MLGNFCDCFNSSNGFGLILIHMWHFFVFHVAVFFTERKQKKSVSYFDPVLRIWTRIRINLGPGSGSASVNNGSGRIMVKIQGC